MDRARSRISPPESDSLTGAAVISGALHVAALVAALVVWPILAPPVALPPDVLPVELISPETNIAEQEKADEPLPVPAELPMPPPPEPQPLDFPEPPPPEPDELAMEVDPTPPPPEPEKPKPPQPLYAMLPQPRVKPKPEKPKEEFDISKISQAVDRASKQPPLEQKQAKASAERTTKAAGAQSAMSMSELDALKARITEAMQKCWRIPDGAPDPASLTMRVKVFLNEDGTVASPPQLLDQGRLGDPYFRAAADSAMRAVHICAPYDLPPDKFAVWGELIVNFAPPGY